MLPLLLATALAYQRAAQPLPVALAQADAVVVATVTEIHAQHWWAEATIEVERSLLGAPPTTVALRLEQPVTAGTKLLLAISEVDGTWVAQPDATAVYSEALEAERRAQIAARPVWPEAQGGWSAVLVLVESEITAKAEVNAWIVYRNTADAHQAFAYREWPRSEHTHWTLTVTRDGAPVHPIPHPHVTPAEIDAYFSEHGHAFEVEVAPGGFQSLPLQRIGSAEPGWGYKQRLGYQSWPLDEPGTYAIAATDRHFDGRTSLVTPAVPLVVRASD